MDIDKNKIFGYLKKNKMTVISIAFLCLSILVIAFFGKITFTYDDDGFTVDAWFANEIYVPFENVESVSISDETVVGKRKSGMETGRVYVGTFENDKYENYKLYVYKSVLKFITVSYNGGTLVFNCDTEQKTEIAYYDIISRIKPFEKDK